MLGDIGLGLVNYVFVLVTILILAAFMLGGGPRWRESLLGQLPDHHAARWQSATDEIAKAVANYVGGALVYQQIENNLIQPRIQSRAVDVQPFIVLVAMLFGSTLFGILGALLAVPLAATIQIIVREILRYRREQPPSNAVPEAAT